MARLHVGRLVALALVMAPALHARGEEPPEGTAVEDRQLGVCDGSDHEEGELRSEPERAERGRDERVCLRAKGERERDRHQRQLRNDGRRRNTGEKRLRNDRLQQRSECGADDDQPPHGKEVPREVRRERLDTVGVFVAFARTHAQRRRPSHDERDGDRDDEPEPGTRRGDVGAAAAAAVGDDRRGNHDRVHDRRGEHERQRRTRVDAARKQPASDRNRPAVADRERERPDRRARHLGGRRQSRHAHQRAPPACGGPQAGGGSAGGGMSGSSCLVRRNLLL